MLPAAQAFWRGGLEMALMGLSEAEQQELGFPGQRLGNHTRRRGIYILPSLLTVGNLLCGYYAILAVLTGGDNRLDFAARAIGIAILFDTFDGFVARLTGTNSEFGKQFDSLADVISFGIAPAALAYAWGVRSLVREASPAVHVVQELAWLVCLAFVICTAWRLARFNVHGMTGSGMRYFVGIPCPAAAGAIAATVHYFQGSLDRWTFSAVFLALVLFLAALMTSRIRYPSFKGVNWARRRQSLVIILIGLTAWSIIFYSEQALIVLAATYVFSGITLEVVRMIRHRFHSQPA
jgi:CDP-diacylglycerol--serine O-phosphatidyltransferase